MTELSDETKLKLAQFSARFRAQRTEADKKKKDAKAWTNSKEKWDKDYAKEQNRKFHLVNKRLEDGTPLQRGEDDTRLTALRKADDLNWQPLAVLVTGQWQVCRCCGNEAIATSGIYFREKHKTINSAKRLRHITALPEGFPIEVAIEGVVLQQCVKCLNGTLVDDILSSLLHGGELRVSNQLELFGG